MDQKLDYQTIAYIRHVIAGHLSNVIGGAEFITKEIGDPKERAKSILENARKIVSIIDDLKSASE